MFFAKPVSVLLLCIVLLLLPATLVPLLNKTAGGPAEHTSVRGETVALYRIGPYRHMPADVAIQGIAQDYITLFVALPLLLISWLQRRHLYAQVVLAGILLYITLTYLFYMNLAMYNELFLVYVALLGCSFYALLLHLLQLRWKTISAKLQSNKTLRPIAVFLIVNACIMTALWLQVIVPPILSGRLYPTGLAHFTSLVVQGFDLAIFLPMSVIVAVMTLRQHPSGAAMVAVYVVFLAILMLALLAKIIAMALSGQNVIPAVFLIPTIGGIAFFAAIKLLMQLHTKQQH